MFALPSCAATSLSSARSSVLRPLRRRATLRRSLHLLSDFRFEQSDPDRFYGRLAEDTVRLIRDLQDGATGKALAGRRILDVGGGPGYFGRAFAAAGVGPGDYVTCEPDVGEMAAAGIRLQSSVRGSGMDLPFACKGGMCSTCRAKLVEGEAPMDINYSLEPWELKAGFVLTCQAKPSSERVVVDYDHV